MKVSVFHAREFSPLKKAHEVNMDDYYQVAVVDALTDDPLEEAFHKTNHIDIYWWKNPGVFQTFDGKGVRSTSVGDVMRLETGGLYMVASVGFELLEGK